MQFNKFSLISLLVSLFLGFGLCKLTSHSTPSSLPPRSTPSPSSAASSNSITPPQTKQLDDGSYYIEAETGTLHKANGGQYTHIGESARGVEAYLGDGGSTISYVLNVPQDKAGDYVLAIKVFDDGKHPSGTRDATIYVNGQQYHYHHVSQPLNDWQWVKINTVNLKAGDNEIVFMKDKSTSAAFILDAFKLTPNH